MSQIFSAMAGATLVLAVNQDPKWGAATLVALGVAWISKVN